MIVWQKIAALGLAGAAGTLSRYGLVRIVQRFYTTAIPTGTLAVNVLGCFLFGVVWVLSTERLTISPELRVVLLTGFLGAFTTFSSFLFETDQLLEQSRWLLAALNLTVEIGAGLGAYVLGTRVATMIG